MAERALLAALGGSCHSPIAVLCEPDGDDLTLRAAIFTPDGAEKIAGEARFAADDPDGPRQLAADLLGRASSGLAAHFAGQG
jgi:hydroxymethylbilane synthase